MWRNLCCKEFCRTISTLLTGFITYNENNKHFFTATLFFPEQKNFWLSKQAFGQIVKDWTSMRSYSKHACHKKEKRKITLCMHVPTCSTLHLYTQPSILKGPPTNRYIKSDVVLQQGSKCIINSGRHCIACNLLMYK